jgi:hypothetical protein
VFEHLFKMFKECSNRLCLLSRWQGRIKKSETGKSGGSHRLLTTTLIGGKRMAINHVTFFLSGINHKASNALTSSACSPEIMPVWAQ